jgi:hypothetical protein
MFPEAMIARFPGSAVERAGSIAPSHHRNP